MKTVQESWWWLVARTSPVRYKWLLFLNCYFFFFRFVWFLSELLNTDGHRVSVSSSGVHVPAVPQPGLYPFPGRVSQRHKASEPPGGPRIGHPQTLWLWQVSNISRLRADLSVCIFHFCIVVTISVSLWIFSLLSVCVALFLGLRFPCVDHSCLFYVWVAYMLLWKQTHWQIQGSHRLRVSSWTVCFLNPPVQSN